MSRAAAKSTQALTETTTETTVEDESRCSIEWRAASGSTCS